VHHTSRYATPGRLASGDAALLRIVATADSSCVRDTPAFSLPLRRARGYNASRQRAKRLCDRRTAAGDALASRRNFPGPYCDYRHAGAMTPISR
jgi:hypothetical protein